MRALVLDQKSSFGISISEVNLPALAPGEVRVKVKSAALNHRDEWCRQGKYPGIKDGIILGSDGAGIVEEIGEGVDEDWLGRAVIINPAHFWGDDQAVQSGDFQILGMPSNGTLAEYIHIEASRLVDKPSHMSFEEAAALPLAGVTAYRALFYHGNITAGKKVLISGFGGGVAQFACQFALAVGADVYVTSSSAAKLEKAVDLGAKGGFNYRAENWVEEALVRSDGFDIIIDSAMGAGVNDLLKLLSPAGKLIFYGATLGNPEAIDARRIFWNQLTLQGTTMGSDIDFSNMIDFVSLHHIIPIIDQVTDLNGAEEAFLKMNKGEQMGKLVLNLD
ncbi:alcohol dehydrogenase [Echinicola pacifica]|uniref:Alcohol dehydrogenase n=1 Tax=Echinicola pacifica TaxID=346377 RepID=A0A918PL16_9BACT|nr:zinc-binding dehydrogenase [Echinicola pacifica]GGZ14803.1 alcohol dehydrogenase [Echinicola pacifica]